MYCRLCDIEYPNSLRFCKWCGGGLVAREAVASQHCPSCGAETEREWVFCNECGVDLATLGAQPKDVVCPACSATVRKGWMFCRQCGEQVATDRAAERCQQCGAGVRPTWTFCKQCAARLKAAPVDERHAFRTVAGIPALPPEDLDEDAPFSNLRSGELPPLDDVIRSDNRRMQPPQAGGTAMPRAASEGQHTGGTHPLTSSRSTGQLDHDALEREIRTNRPVEAPVAPAPPPPPPPPQPASFGRLEASELIHTPSLPPPIERPRPNVAAEAPAAWRPSPEPTGPTAAPAARPPAAPAPPAPPPALDSTQAFASPVFESSYTPAVVPPAQPPAVTEAQQRVETAPPVPAPTQATSQPAQPWSQPSYVPEQRPPAYAPQAAPVMPQPSYDRKPTVSLPPETTGQFPPPPVQPPRGSGSSVKWIALGLVVLAVLVVGAVAAMLAYRTWKARQTPVETPVVQAPQTPEAPPTKPESPPQSPTVPEGMVSVPGATFGLGTNDPTADEYSLPQHDVTVKTFYIDLTEVTNAQYKAFVDETGHTPPKEGWVNGAPKPGTESWPVVYVSWEDASAYAKWAGKRLPTEAEWELAARGTDGRKYPWGDTWDPTRGNLGKDGKTGTPDPVGSHPTGKSPCGALDMLGNVWEWTSSPFTIYPGGKAAPPEGEGFRIVRGGAYDNPGKNTVTYRGFFKFDSAWPKVGFRCAKDAQ